MTRLAIFSDIHANLPAMDVVGRHILAANYDAKADVVVFGHTHVPYHRTVNRIDS